MISLSSRPYLFVDETLVERHEKTSLRLHSPRRENVALTFDAPWEGPTSAYCTVLDMAEFAGEEPRYRLYYRGKATGDDYEPDLTCVAESDDGICWRRRLVWKYAVAGSYANNAVWNGVNDISHNMHPFLDRNPNATPDARFKAVGGLSRKGLYGLASPDGLAWRLMREEPVMTKGDFDSLNLAFWDTEKGCYVAYIRQFRDGIRSIRRCTSEDFIYWSDPEWLDFGEGPLEHFYTNAIQPYPRDPGLYLGFPKRFMPQRTRHAQCPEPGVSDAVLIASRDGLHFPRRFREAFIRPGLDQKNWTHRNIMPAPGMIRTSPSEYSLYWSEHYAHHDNRVRRGTIRVDGFASLHADWPGGEAVSVPVRLEGDRLVLNMATSAAGSVRVELQDASGKPLPGHALADCDELFGDDLARVVTWKGSSDLSRLRGETVRLRLALCDADVYSAACQA